MIKIRFFISAAIYVAISVMLPFLVPVPAMVYLVLIGVLTIGFLVPSILSLSREIRASIPLWIFFAVTALVLYDYLKIYLDSNHVFLGNWKKFYPAGLLIFLGLHFYSWFTAELVFKQITRK